MPCKAGGWRAKLTGAAPPSRLSAGGGHISGRPSKAARRGGGAGGGWGGRPAFELPEPQDPIQPGSTQLGGSYRSYRQGKSVGTGGGLDAALDALVLLWADRTLLRQGM